MPGARASTARQAHRIGISDTIPRKISKSTLNGVRVSAGIVDVNGCCGGSCGGGGIGNRGASCNARSLAANVAAMLNTSRLEIQSIVNAGSTIAYSGATCV